LLEEKKSGDAMTNFWENRIADKVEAVKRARYAAESKTVVPPEETITVGGRTLTLEDFKKEAGQVLRPVREGEVVPEDLDEWVEENLRSSREVTSREVLPRIEEWTEAERRMYEPRNVDTWVDDIAGRLRNVRESSRSARLQAQRIAERSRIPELRRIAEGELPPMWVQRSDVAESHPVVASDQPEVVSDVPESKQAVAADRAARVRRARHTIDAKQAEADRLSRPGELPRFTRMPGRYAQSIRIKKDRAYFGKAGKYEIPAGLKSEPEIRDIVSKGKLYSIPRSFLRWITRSGEGPLSQAGERILSAGTKVGKVLKVAGPVLQVVSIAMETLSLQEKIEAKKTMEEWLNKHPDAVFARQTREDLIRQQSEIHRRAGYLAADVATGVGLTGAAAAGFMAGGPAGLLIGIGIAGIVASSESLIEDAAKKKERDDWNKEWYGSAENPDLDYYFNKRDPSGQLDDWMKSILDYHLDDNATPEFKAYIKDLQLRIGDITANVSLGRAGYNDERFEIMERLHESNPLHGIQQVEKFSEDQPNADYSNEGFSLMSQGFADKLDNGGPGYKSNAERYADVYAQRAQSEEEIASHQLTAAQSEERVHQDNEAARIATGDDSIFESTGAEDVVKPAPPDEKTYIPRTEDAPAKDVLEGAGAGPEKIPAPPPTPQTKTGEPSASTAAPDPVSYPEHAHNKYFIGTQEDVNRAHDAAQAKIGADFRRDVADYSRPEDEAYAQSTEVDAPEAPAPVASAGVPAADEDEKPQEDHAVEEIAKDMMQRGSGGFTDARGYWHYPIDSETAFTSEGLLYNTALRRQ
jgi:hypothetical protein